MNSLTSLPLSIFAGLTSLTTLYHYSNGLAALPLHILDSLVSLQTLNVRNNNLQSIPISLFSQTDHLSKLIADANAITELPIGTFGGAPLTYITLANNPITEVDSDAFVNLTLSLVHCDLGDTLCTSCTAECGAHSTCTWDGAVECGCQLGYSNPTACTDTDYCIVDGCGAHAACVDQLAPSLNRTCTCNTGYSGNPYFHCFGMLFLPNLHFVKLIPFS